MIVAVGGRQSADDISGASGMGATWARAIRATQSFNNIEIWYGNCGTAGTTVSFTSATTNIRTAVIFEVSNLTGATDVIGTATTGTGYGIATSSVSTATATTFVLAAGVVDAQGTFSSVTNSFTHGATIDGGSGGSRVTTTTAYKILSATATESTTITLTGTGSPNRTGVIVGFK